MGNCSWEPVAGSLAWEPLPGNIAWEPACWEPCVDTSSWKPLPGNTCLKTCSGRTLFCLEKHVLEIFLGKLAGKPCLDTSSWKPLPGNTCLKHVLRTLFCLGKTCCSLGKRFLETLKTVPEIRACKNLFLGTLPGNLFLENSSWEPLLGNLFLGTLLGNLFLATLACEPLAGESLPGNLLGNLFLGTFLKTSWEPCLGTSSWKHSSWTSSWLGNLFLVTG